MKMLNLIAVALVLIGSINLGLMGLIGLNIVGIVLPMYFLMRIFNIAVGASAVWIIIFGKDMLKNLFCKQ